MLQKLLVEDRSYRKEEDQKKVLFMKHMQETAGIVNEETTEEPKKKKKKKKPEDSQSWSHSHRLNRIIAIHQLRIQNVYTIAMYMYILWIRLI